MSHVKIECPHSDCLKVWWSSFCVAPSKIFSCVKHSLHHTPVPSFCIQKIFTTGPVWHLYFFGKCEKYIPKSKTGFFFSCTQRNSVEAQGHNALCAVMNVVLIIKSYGTNLLVQGMLDDCIYRILKLQLLGLLHIWRHNMWHNCVLCDANFSLVTEQLVWHSWVEGHYSRGI